MLDGAAVHILIVDENPGLRTTLARAFSRHGYRCSLAASAAEAERAVDALHPDAVVLDWVFRDGSGVGLARRLRERARPCLPIIALSVWEEPYEFARYEGIDAYFVKPAAFEAIERAIRTSRIPAAALPATRSKL